MNTNKVSNRWTLLAIAFAFVVAVLLNNILFDKARLDLTEGKLYSISAGTLQVLEQLEEPINVYFFYSNKASEGMTSLRSYAKRIQSLLEEYERYSDNKINFNVVDPEPFSEAEDRAAEFGLSAAPINSGDSIYLGLAATNALGEKEIIPFFDPSQEKLLEYNISKLIHKLSNPTPLNVSVLSSLPVLGGVNTNPMAMQMGQPQNQPAWVSFEQLQQLYTVNLLDNEAETIPEETSVLILVHPKSLTDAQLYAVDQYVLGGGKLIVFVDPAAESDTSSPNMMGMSVPSSSELTQLFAAWGIDFDQQQVVIDAANGLEIRMPNGQPGRHAGYIGFSTESVSNEEVIVSSLDSINGASVGELKASVGAKTNFIPLIMTSTYSDSLNATDYMMARQNPESLLNNFTPSNAKKIVAARISGAAKSAFEKTPDEANQTVHIKEYNDIQVLVVADTDLLTDNFWVQKSNFFGQTILQPFANNGDFLINAVDNYGGSTALMSIRGKGQSQRPFEVVEQLTLEAEEKFRTQEQQLQQELEQTEQQLSQLQGQQGDGTALTLTQEQENTINQFIDKKLQIRKQLREVRHQLDKDIESLGTWLKVVNIGVFPLLLTLLLYLFARKKRLTRLDFEESA